MNLEELHSRFIAGETLNEIAINMKVSYDWVSKTICAQRKINPEKWPSRKGGSFIQQFHVYECEDCILTFAVEQDYDDQSNVTCPVCWDGNIRDVASGEMKLKN